ncbi:MAG TPA: sulfatase [Candidatus Polarisedimenticolia bacterium]|nr:sulfatase [Candidatus Polarisedimenticolia bacterium]
MPKKRLSWLRPMPAVLVLLLLPACSRDARPASLLLITVDTLRADHLGAYGYTRPTSPRIDSLAREGILFEKAYATVPRTTQSVATILTGLYPKHHRARGLFSPLVPANLTLAEILRERGYSTWAVVSNIFLQPGKGFEQGFDSYSNPRSRFDSDSSEQITGEALEKLSAAKDRPFFLWVHYLDPHWTYDPRGEFSARFDPDYRPSKEMKELREGKSLKGDIIFHNRLGEEDRHHLVALYDGEIAQVDAQIGRLLDRMPAGVKKNLLIVLTSDHGESLCEHQYCFAHGETLYDDTLRVPLLFHHPGLLRGGKRIAGNVSLMDLAPSILRLLRLPPRPGMDGMALFAEAPSGSSFEARGSHDLLFAETDYQLIHAANPRFLIPGAAGRWSGLRKDSLKLIRIPRPEGPLHELFQLATDPGEASPLALEALPLGFQLQRELEIWTDDEQGAGESLDETLTPEQRERLKSLGYLQ